MAAPAVRSVSRARPRTALTAYMAEVRGIPALTREREQELVARWKDGDARAGNELVAGSLRHVIYIARRYVASRESLDDLVAEGNLALLHALRKYDPGFGTRFGTYARLWVRAYLTRYVRRDRSIVSTPLHQQAALMTKVRAERQKLAAVAPADSVDELVASRLDTTVEEIRRVEYRFTQRDTSFDVPFYADQPSLHETIPGRSARPDDEASARELVRLLRDAIVQTELSDAERTILERRLLCAPGDEPSLAEIGREIEFTREWTRRLEQRAMAKLEKTLNERR